jgi:hypothetical protein
MTRAGGGGDPQAGVRVKLMQVARLSGVKPGVGVGVGIGIGIEGNDMGQATNDLMCRAAIEHYS